MVNKKLSDVKDFAKEFYDTLDEAHGIVHGSRVSKLAMLIHKIEGGDPFLVEAGAWLHQFHDNLEGLKVGLENIDISTSEREALYHIVEMCRPTKIQNARTVEAKVVYDADALEMIGPHGNIREIYCNLCVRKMALRQSISKTIEIENLFISTMQTETGKKICTLLSDRTKKFWSLYDILEQLDESILKMI